jgi:hypothetical protein
MCPVNGIRDLIQWRTGRDWSNEFVSGLGQCGGFAYLRVNPADPPRQVYWGIAGPRQHRYLADLLGASYSEFEGRAFKSAWPRALAALEAGTPPVIGPLDMYYLPFYPGLYHERHISIHYLLLIGAGDERAYVQDTGQDDVQAIALGELKAAWDVNVPGLGKRNRLVTLDVPRTLPPVDALVCRAIADQSRMMLKPPVSMLGIPAMRKVAREMAGWPRELGEERAAKSLGQVRAYLNSPPDENGQHLTAGRDIYIAFLEQASAMTGRDFAGAAGHLRRGMALVPEIADALRRERLEEAGRLFDCIADEETSAHSQLIEAVGAYR